MILISVNIISFVACRLTLSNFQLCFVVSISEGNCNNTLSQVNKMCLMNNECQILRLHVHISCNNLSDNILNAKVWQSGGHIGCIPINIRTM